MTARGNAMAALAALAAALALALAAPAAAQEADGAQEGAALDDDFGFFGSEDELFAEVEETEGAVGASLLVYDSVRVGGSVSGSATASWTWNDPWGGVILTDFDDYALDPALSATLFFDARPAEGTRFYGSMKSSWPFETSKTFLTGTQPGEAASVTQVNMKVFELFTDFNWDDALFFRFGKQTINWGVGYFFSPANVMNLEAIDPFDTGRQLEGPVSLRAHYPVPGSQHNLWAYAVFDSPDMKPEDLAVAAKAELVFGAWEFGLGGKYQYDEPLRGVLTASGSIDRVTLFGEGYLARGSDKAFVTSVSILNAPPTFTQTETYDDRLFLKGSGGFMWNQSDWKLTVAGQYLYDGEGYADAEREKLISQARAIIASNEDIGTPVFKYLIYGSGRHYAALSVSKGELFVEDLSASVMVLANLSDLSGTVRPGLSYRLFDGMSASVSAAFAFGGEDSEYIVLADGPAMSLSFGLSLGSGSF